MAEGPPRRRWPEAVFLAAFAAGLAWCGWGLWHDRSLAGRFDRIHLGMDRGAVEAVLGAPDRESGCEGGGPSLPREDCVRELSYASAFAPLIRTRYVIQLDRGGRVLEAEPVR